MYTVFTILFLLFQSVCTFLSSPMEKVLVLCKTKRFNPQYCVSFLSLSYHICVLTIVQLNTTRN